MNSDIYEISFHKRYYNALAGGEKTATTRTRVVAGKGKAVLYLGRGTFLNVTITDIRGLPKEKACEKYWREEGYNSAAEMSADLTQIYPHISDVDIVYVHTWEIEDGPYSTRNWGWQS